MPAMSPTMTEGNIASWKVKEGESFSAGDVLLEIETDKAQMDVEAQDDGILAKIVVPGGTHNVKVGKIIAMLAEEGDDILSVEMPAQDSQASSPAPSARGPEKDTKSKEQTNKHLGQQDSGRTKRVPHFTTPYPPAVLRLLQEYSIEDPQSIPATGPHGRLLKGDVLAHVGSITSDMPKALQDILAVKSRLDLSNITVQQTQQSQAHVQPSPPSSAQAPAPAHIDVVVRLTELFRIQRHLSEMFSQDMSIDSLIEKAGLRALADVPTFGLRKIPASDLIFAELIGESSERQTIHKMASSLHMQTSPKEQSKPHLQGGEEMYTPKLVKSVPGKAVLHFQRVELPPDPLPSIDPFDALLGLNPSITSLKTAKSNVSSQDVRVRLEYDSAIIGTDAAAAYLARFQHHLESPSQLIL